MLKALIKIWKDVRPLQHMEDNFVTMVNLAYENTKAAGGLYFSRVGAPARRDEIYEKDVQINQLERSVRKQIIMHLSVPGNQVNGPYCLALMTLVKDVERIGDFAKNLSEIVDIAPDPLPDNDLTAEMHAIYDHVMEAFCHLARIYTEQDRDRALAYIHSGRSIAHRCDALIEKNARSDHDARTATSFVLGTRFLKRINGHIVNVLTSTVMPLHKIDYYDEESLRPGEAERVNELKRRADSIDTDGEADTLVEGKE